MNYTPISPFMRPISHAQITHISASSTDSGTETSVNKWELLRELSKAKEAFGVSDRDLAVLQCLLSFFPEKELRADTDMVVFPSNKTICERLNGMPCSTMRRRLSKLVEVALILRRDSPNGKRYVRKHGKERIAFGFDLSPLLANAQEIFHAANAVRDAEDEIRHLRECVSLMRRDLCAVSEFGRRQQPGLELWENMEAVSTSLAKALRRKLSLQELTQYRESLLTLLEQARDIIDGPDTEEMNTNGSQFEHHHHSSNNESIESEPGIENEKYKVPDIPCEDEQEDRDVQNEDSYQLPKIPLHLVLESCPALRTFYDADIRHWHQLYDAATFVRPAMGISSEVWEVAKAAMGPEQASVALVAMLERFAEIRSPGAYLRALSNKAAKGTFSCGPMIMALSSRKMAA